MNQSELIARTAVLTNISKVAVESVLKNAADVVAAALSDGDDVTLPGIGKLCAVHKEARVGRNPKTGDAHPIPAHKAIKFRVAKALKDAVAG